MGAAFAAATDWGAACALEGTLSGVDRYGQLSDAELAEIALAVRDEQRRRAVAAGDPETVAGEGFARCFDKRGSAVGPQVVSGLLVIPGRLVQRGTSHDCSFCVVDDSWVWEHTEVLFDDVRRDSSGMLSVTVLPAFDGLTVTQVESKYRAGSHQRQRQTTWNLVGGQLIRATVPAPVRTGASHR